MLRIKFTQFSGIFFSLFLYSCISVSPPFRTIVNPYQELPSRQSPFTYAFVHEDEKFSTLYFNFESALLSFKKNESDSIFRSVYRIVCHVQKRISNKRSADSSVFLFKLNSRSPIPARIEDKCRIKLAQGSKYFVEFIVQDVQSGNKKIMSGIIDKTNEFVSENYFLVTDTFSKVPILNANVNKTLFLKNNRIPLQPNLDVSYYSFSPELSLPPFVTDEGQPISTFSDTNFRIFLSKNFFCLKPTKNGIYLCKTSKDVRDGLRIPILIDNSTSFETLRYLSTKIEFDSLDSNQDKILTEKNFWLNRCESRQRAVVLMTEWRRRMEICNYYFTSDREGWKTDRGMIYMLFGPPVQLNFTISAESWIYSENLVFEFKIRENLISNNDFVLERKPEYSSVWYAAVDTWRQGRINYGSKLKDK